MSLGGYPWPPRQDHQRKYLPFVRIVNKILSF
jgi:hypothetical protein